jgi:hypothetical protein
MGVATATAAGRRYPGKVTRMMAQDSTPEEIRTVSAAIAGPSKEFRDACYEKWKRTQPPTAPDILYHYTNSQAFREILNSGTVWASDIRYMNDASEVRYVSDVLKSAIKEAKRFVHGDDECELLERISNTFDITEMLRVFALCFSELHDSIPQWIAYAGRRGGFAIGLKLDPHLLQVEHEEGGAQTGYLVKVVYDDYKLRDVSEDLIAQLLELYRHAREPVAEHLRNFVMASFCQAWRAGFSNLLFSFKHPGFEYEQEWRLVYYLEQFGRGTQYHVGTMGLVPHLALRLTHTAGIYLNRLPLAEVVQGPTAEPALALEALKGFLRDVNHVMTEAKRSEMPLRF